MVSVNDYWLLQVFPWCQGLCVIGLQDSSKLTVFSPMIQTQSLPSPPLEENLWSGLYWRRVSCADQSVKISHLWAFMAIRMLPMQHLARFWKLGGISMLFRIALSLNIWFGQMQRHLVWDCKVKESAALFFCCDSMGFTTVSTEPMAANSHTCGQSRGVKEQIKEHRIFCPCVERWKTRTTKGKDSTKSKKGNRMEEIINFPSRSRAIPFTLRISLRRRSLLSGWALLIGAFQ